MSGKFLAPTSSAEVIASFLEFVVKEIDIGALTQPGCSVELRRLLLDVLETTHLKGENVHLFAAELDCFDNVK